MTLKIVLLISFLTVIKAGSFPTNHIYHSFTKGLHSPRVASDVETNNYDSHPQYNYSYTVDDKLTGDFKRQNEQRDGDEVQGEYSLLDADGYKRIVKYSADDENGFSAVVKRVPLVETAIHLPASVVHSEYFVAPTVVTAAAPVINSVTPVSQYARRYSSYDAPIYLKSALGHDNQN